jgi:predicted nucleic acid-binding protein
MIPAPAKPIVIDTNVCLDLFVFRDPRWAPLLAALESGRVRAVTRADCRDEYRIVLHYSHLPLDDDAAARRAASMP